MAINLNLLPEDKSVNKNLSQALSFVRSITTLLLVVFVVSLVGILAFLIINKAELNSLNNQNTTLKSQVLALEKVEQQTVLLKDRLGKIVSVQKNIESLSSASDIGTIESALPTGATLEELSVNDQKTEATFVFNSASSFGQFIDQISNNLAYKSIELSLFGYSPTTGYVATLVFKL